jgi:hypothetical protein
MGCLWLLSCFFEDYNFTTFSPLSSHPFFGYGIDFWSYFLMKYFFKVLTTLTVACGVFVSILGTDAYALREQKGRKKDTSFSIQAAQGLIDEALKIIRTGGKASDADILLKNAIGLIEIDPEPGKFIDGRITINYDSFLVSVEQVGWFGDWGIDSTLPPPPVETLPEHIPWLLQTTPNSQLTVNTVLLPPSPGSTISTLQVEYDWGTQGHIASSSNDFNFFGIVFKTLQDTTFGDFKSSVNLPDNDLFRRIDVDSLGADDIDKIIPKLANFNRCIPSNSSEKTLCGVSSVPEPLTILGAATATGFGAFFKRKRKLSESSENENTKVS